MCFVRRRDESKIVAVDLQEMAPIEGVTLVQVILLQSTS